MLSVRAAEATSMQRATEFKKPKVNLFFDKLKKLMFDDEGKQSFLLQIYSTSTKQATQYVRNQGKW